jgi:hypothetical protein
MFASASNKRERHYSDNCANISSGHLVGAIRPWLPHNCHFNLGVFEIASFWCRWLPRINYICSSKKISMFLVRHVAIPVPKKS